MMTSGVSFLASLANRVRFEHCTQGTPLLLPSHRPQLLVIAPEEAYKSAFQCDGIKPNALVKLAGVIARQGKIREAADCYLRGLHAWPECKELSVAYLAFASEYGFNDPRASAFIEHLLEIDKDASER